MLLRSTKLGHRRRGMSLLEVLTSLAIFIFSAYALTQMVDAASNSATKARRLAKAQLLAETKMDEVVAGILPMSGGGGPITEEIEGWSYSIQATPEQWSSVQDPNTGSSITGLSSVIVTVNYTMTGAEPIEYSISRIVLDPSLRVPAQPPTSSSMGSSSTGGSP